MINKKWKAFKLIVYITPKSFHLSESPASLLITDCQWIIRNLKEPGHWISSEIVSQIYRIEIAKFIWIFEVIEGLILTIILYLTFSYQILFIIKLLYISNRLYVFLILDFLVSVVPNWITGLQIMDSVFYKLFQKCLNDFIDFFELDLSFHPNLALILLVYLKCILYLLQSP